MFIFDNWIFANPDACATKLNNFIKILGQRHGTFYGVSVQWRLQVHLVLRKLFI